MPIVVCFLGDQLCHRIDLVKMTLAQRFQAVAECTGEAVQHPIFDIPVFNDIGNVRRDLMDHLQILWVLLDAFSFRASAARRKAGGRGYHLKLSR